MIIRGDAAHVVVHSRQDGDWLTRHVDIGKNARGLTDAWQPLVQYRRIKVVEVQEKVILFLADAAALANFDGHCSRDNVA